jgi:hypothetical protein
MTAYSSLFPSSLTALNAVLPERTQSAMSPPKLARWPEVGDRFTSLADFKLACFRFGGACGAVSPRARIVLADKDLDMLQLLSDASSGCSSRSVTTFTSVAFSPTAVTLARVISAFRVGFVDKKRWSPMSRPRPVTRAIRTSSSGADNRGRRPRPCGTGSRNLTGVLLLLPTSAVARSESKACRRRFQKRGPPCRMRASISKTMLRAESARRYIPFF